MKNYYFWTRELDQEETDHFVYFDGENYTVRKYTFDNDQMLIAKDAWNDKYIIWFRGSDLEIRDWVSNSNIWWFTKRDGIHDGFLESYKKFQSIINALTITSNTEVIIGGYSRGGGIALAGAYCLSTTHTNISCVVFGCPPIFTKVGREAFNRSCIWCTRYEIDADIVPTSVVAYVAGLRHVGNREEIKLKGWNRFLPKIGLTFRIIRHKLYEKYCR